MKPPTVEELAEKVDAYLSTPRSRCRVILAKYSTHCMWCGESIPFRECIWWVPGGGCAHLDCFDESHPEVAA